MFFDLFAKKTRVVEALREHYTLVGMFIHISGWGTTSAMLQMAKPDMLILAPKGMHAGLQEYLPDVTLMSSQMWATHPTSHSTILYLYAIQENGQVLSALLRRKETPK
jgi:hypothetical protein